MNKFISTLAAASAALLMAGSAQAAYVLTAEDTTFTLTQVDNDTLTLRIQNALSGTGAWASATQLDNIALKDLGGSFTGGSISGPGSWSSSLNELSAKGCTGGGSGGVCFDASPSVALSDDMLFTIDLAGAALNIDANLGPHLKVRFLDANGAKVGGLLSQNLSGPTTNTLPPQEEPVPPQNVPEPGSLALAGVAI